MSGLGDIFGGLGTRAMGGVQNLYANLLAPPGNNKLSYEQRVAEAKRQQVLAEALREQAASDIPVQSYKGTQAPIPWTAILAKALQGAGASFKEGRAEKEMGAATEANRVLAEGLLKKAQQGGQTETVIPSPAGTAPPGPAPVAPIAQPGPLEGPGGPMTPMVPMPQRAQQPPAAGPMGGPGMSPQPPTGPTAPMAQPQGPQATPQMNQPGMDQLAALAMADPGPYTNRLLQTVGPQIASRMQTDYQQQLPMSVADTQRITATGQQQRDTATFENQLPLTAAQKAQQEQQQRELDETRSYHRQLSGTYALDADGLPKTDDPITQSWVQAVVSGNATMLQVPAAQRTRVVLALNQTPKQAYNPQAARRLTLASGAITKPFTDLPQYQLTAGGLPYLQRIEAAMQTPGSVSDQDLLDSLTKLNTAGNAVTEAQVNLITHGQSYRDWVGVAQNKFANGGVLSPDQRKQIVEIANHVYENYRKGYEPVYKQATDQLRAAGIPEQFWTIPNLNKLNARQSTIGGGGGGGGGQSGPKPKTYRYNSDGSRTEVQN